ncbi:MAG: glycosyltransferase family 4 protein [bacterium]|nr:glycosyltransferase family 4 protein [bacterium]
MRILVLTPFFYPHLGGSQRYIEDLYAELIVQNPEIQVDVLCYNTDHAAATESYRGLSIYRVPCIQVLPGQFALPNYFSIWQILRKLKAQHAGYDIVNAHTRFFDSSWWAPLVARYFQAKSLLTDHCAYHPAHQVPLVSVIARLADKVIVPVVAPHYDAVTVVSQATQSFVKQVGLDNTTVIQGSVDPTIFKPQQDVQQRKVPNSTAVFTTKDMVITYAGRFIESKGVRLMADAVKKFGSEHSNVHFLFAGNGPLYQGIKSELTGERVHFLGQLTREQMADLLGISNVFIYPSLHHEGLPLAIVEAAAAENVIIATAQGGTSEVIDDDVTGFLITPSVDEVLSKIELILKHPAQAKKIATAARVHVVASYNTHQVTKRYFSFLQSLLS